MEYDLDTGKKSVEWKINFIAYKSRQKGYEIKHSFIEFMRQAQQYKEL